MDLLRHGRHKFPHARLIASSQGLGWQGVAAELRSHPAGDIPAIQPDQVEVTIAVRGERDAVVSRKGAGQRQETAVVPGQIWISPVGVVEDDIRITRHLSAILHLYLPASPPHTLAEALGTHSFGADSLRYLAGVEDDLVRQVGLSLLGEMMAPSAAGRLLAESLAQTLTVRLLQAYAIGGRSGAPTTPRAGWRDDTRVRRAVDFMRAHLEEDIGLAEIATAAGLSPFHFSRVFRRSTGQPPHRYLAQLRLDSAKQMLAQGPLPVAEIAAACCFSGQANFARAFKHATGLTPVQVRAASRGA